MNKTVMLDPEIHRQLDVIRAKKVHKSFNEAIEYLINYYQKREGNKK